MVKTSCRSFHSVIFASAFLLLSNLSCSGAFSRHRSLPTRKPRASLGVAKPIDISTDQQDPCPPGFFLDECNECCSPLGPLGRVSQVVETSVGPFKKASTAIQNLFGIDKSKIGSLGVPFVLSYSVISNLNGAVSFSVAWYMTCARTGLSPLWQWKELLKSYATIYALIQVLRPFRVAAAIAMSKLSKEFLDQTQAKMDCSRKHAVLFQFVLSQLMLAVCASLGVLAASGLSGVPIFRQQ